MLLVENLNFSIRSHDLHTIRSILSDDSSAVLEAFGTYHSIPIFDLNPEIPSRSLQHYPLYVAVVENNTTVVDLLLEYGFSPLYYIMDTINVRLLTSPLSIAVSNNNIAIARLLFHHHKQMTLKNIDTIASMVERQAHDNDSYAYHSLESTLQGRFHHTSSTAATQKKDQTQHKFPKILSFPVNYYEQNEMSILFHFLGLRFLDKHIIESQQHLSSTQTPGASRQHSSGISPPASPSSHGHSTPLSPEQKQASIIARELLVFPLELAIRMGNVEMADLLIYHGADVNNPFFSKSVMAILYNNFYNAVTVNEQLLQSLNIPLVRAQDQRQTARDKALPQALCRPDNPYAQLQSAHFDAQAAAFEASDNTAGAKKSQVTRFSTFTSPQPMIKTHFQHAAGTTPNTMMTTTGNDQDEHSAIANIPFKTQISQAIAVNHLLEDDPFAADASIIHVPVLNTVQPYHPSTLDVLPSHHIDPASSPRDAVDGTQSGGLRQSARMSAGSVQLAAELPHAVAPQQVNRPLTAQDIYRKYRYIDNPLHINTHDTLDQYQNIFDYYISKYNASIFAPNILGLSAMQQIASTYIDSNLLTSLTLYHGNIQVIKQLTVKNKIYMYLLLSNNTVYQQYVAHQRFDPHSGENLKNFINFEPTSIIASSHKPTLQGIPPHIFRYADYIDLPQYFYKKMRQHHEHVHRTFESQFDQYVKNIQYCEQLSLQQRQFYHKKILSGAHYPSSGVGSIHGGADGSGVSVSGDASAHTTNNKLSLSPPPNLAPLTVDAHPSSKPATSSTAGYGHSHGSFSPKNQMKSSTQTSTPSHAQDTIPGTTISRSIFNEFSKLDLTRPEYPSPWSIVVPDPHHFSFNYHYRRKNDDVPGIGHQQPDSWHVYQTERYISTYQASSHSQVPITTIDGDQVMDVQLTTSSSTVSTTTVTAQVSLRNQDELQRRLSSSSAGSVSPTTTSSGKGLATPTKLKHLTIPSTPTHTPNKLISTISSDALVLSPLASPRAGPLNASGTTAHVMGTTGDLSTHGANLLLSPRSAYQQSQGQTVVFGLASPRTTNLVDIEDELDTMTAPRQGELPQPSHRGTLPKAFGQSHPAASTPTLRPSEPQTPPVSYYKDHFPQTTHQGLKSQPFSLPPPAIGDRQSFGHHGSGTPLMGNVMSSNAVISPLLLTGANQGYNKNVDSINTRVAKPVAEIDESYKNHPFLQYFFGSSRLSFSVMNHITSVYLDHVHIYEQCMVFLWHQLAAKFLQQHPVLQLLMGLTPQSLLANLPPALLTALKTPTPTPPTSTSIGSSSTQPSSGSGPDTPSWSSNHTGDYTGFGSTAFTPSTAKDKGKKDKPKDKSKDKDKEKEDKEKEKDKDASARYYYQLLHSETCRFVLECLRVKHRADAFHRDNPSGKNMATVCQTPSASRPSTLAEYDPKHLHLPSIPAYYRCAIRHSIRLLYLIMHGQSTINSTDNRGRQTDGLPSSISSGRHSISSDSISSPNTLLHAKSNDFSALKSSMSIYNQVYSGLSQPQQRLNCIPIILQSPAAPTVIASFQDYLQATRALSSTKQFISTQYYQNQLVTVSEVSSLSIILDNLLDIALNGSEFNQIKHLLFSPIAFPYLIPYFYHFLLVDEICAILTRPQAFMFALCTRRYDILNKVVSYTENEYTFRLDDGYDPAFLRAIYISMQFTRYQQQQFHDMISNTSGNPYLHQIDPSTSGLIAELSTPSMMMSSVSLAAGVARTTFYQNILALQQRYGMNLFSSSFAAMSVAQASSLPPSLSFLYSSLARTHGANNIHAVVNGRILSPSALAEHHQQTPGAGGSQPQSRLPPLSTSIAEGNETITPLSTPMAGSEKDKKKDKKEKEKEKDKEKDRKKKDKGVSAIDQFHEFFRFYDIKQANMSPSEFSYYASAPHIFDPIGFSASQALNLSSPGGQGGTGANPAGGTGPGKDISLTNHHPHHAEISAMTNIQGVNDHHGMNLIYTTSSQLPVTLEDIEQKYQHQTLYHANGILTFPSVITIHGCLLFTILLKTAWISGIELILRNSYQLVPHVYSSILLSSAATNTTTTTTLATTIVTQKNYHSIRRKQAQLLNKYTELLREEGCSPMSLFCNYDLSAVVLDERSNKNPNNAQLPPISSEAQEILKDFRREWLHTTFADITRSLSTGKEAPSLLHLASSPPSSLSSYVGEGPAPDATGTTLAPGTTASATPQSGLSVNPSLTSHTTSKASSKFSLSTPTAGQQTPTAGSGSSKFSAFGKFFRGDKDKDKDKQKDKEKVKIKEKEKDKGKDRHYRQSSMTDFDGINPLAGNAGGGSNPALPSQLAAHSSLLGPHPSHDEPHTHVYFDGKVHHPISLTMFNQLQYQRQQVLRHYELIAPNAHNQNIFIYNHPHYLTVAEHISLMVESIASNLDTNAHSTLVYSNPFHTLLSVSSFTEIQAFVKIAQLYSLPVFSSLLLLSMQHYQHQVNIRKVITDRLHQLQQQQSPTTSTRQNIQQQQSKLLSLSLLSSTVTKQQLHGHEFLLHDKYQRYYPIEVVIRTTHTMLPLQSSIHHHSVLNIPYYRGKTSQNFYYLRYLLYVFTCTDQHHLINLLSLAGDIESVCSLRSLTLPSIKHYLQSKVTGGGAATAAVQAGKGTTTAGGESSLRQSNHTIQPRGGLSTQQTQELTAQLSPEERRLLQLFLCTDITLAMMSGDPKALAFVAQLQQQQVIHNQYHDKQQQQQASSQENALVSPLKLAGRFSTPSLSPSMAMSISPPAAYRVKGSGPTLLLATAWDTLQQNRGQWIEQYITLDFYNIYSSYQSNNSSRLRQYHFYLRQLLQRRLRHASTSAAASYPLEPVAYQAPYYHPISAEGYDEDHQSSAQGGYHNPYIGPTNHQVSLLPPIRNYATMQSLQSSNAPPHQYRREDHPLGNPHDRFDQFGRTSFHSMQIDAPSSYQRQPGGYASATNTPLYGGNQPRREIIPHTPLTPISGPLATPNSAIKRDRHSQGDEEPDNDSPHHHFTSHLQSLDDDDDDAITRPNQSHFTGCGHQRKPSRQITIHSMRDSAHHVDHITVPLHDNRGIAPLVHDQNSLNMNLHLHINVDPDLSTGSFESHHPGGAVPLLTRPSSRGDSVRTSRRMSHTVSMFDPFPALTPSYSRAPSVVTLQNAGSVAGSTSASAAAAGLQQLLIHDSSSNSKYNHRPSSRSAVPPLEEPALLLAASSSHAHQSKQNILLPPLHSHLSQQQQQRQSMQHQDALISPFLVDDLLDDSNQGDDDLEFERMSLHHKGWDGSKTGSVDLTRRSFVNQSSTAAAQSQFLLDQVLTDENQRRSQVFLRTSLNGSTNVSDADDDGAEDPSTTHRNEHNLRSSLTRLSQSRLSSSLAQGQGTTSGNSLDDIFFVRRSSLPSTIVTAISKRGSFYATNDHDQSGNTAAVNASVIVDDGAHTTHQNQGGDRASVNASHAMARSLASPPQATHSIHHSGVADHSSYRTFNVADEHGADVTYQLSTVYCHDCRYYSNVVVSAPSVHGGGLYSSRIPSIIYPYNDQQHNTSRDGESPSRAAKSSLMKSQSTSGLAHDKSTSRQGLHHTVSPGDVVPYIANGFDSISNRSGTYNEHGHEVSPSYCCHYCFSPIVTIVDIHNSNVNDVYSRNQHILLDPIVEFYHRQHCAVQIAHQQIEQQKQKQAHNRAAEDVHAVTDHHNPKLIPPRSLLSLDTTSDSTHGELSVASALTHSPRAHTATTASTPTSGGVYTPTNASNQLHRNRIDDHDPEPTPQTPVREGKRGKHIRMASNTSMPAGIGSPLPNHHQTPSRHHRNKSSSYDVDESIDGASVSSFSVSGSHTPQRHVFQHGNTQDDFSINSRTPQKSFRPDDGHYHKYDDSDHEQQHMDQHHVEDHQQHVAMTSHLPAQHMSNIIVDCVIESSSSLVDSAIAPPVHLMLPQSSTALAEQEISMAELPNAAPAFFTTPAGQGTASTDTQLQPQSSDNSAAQPNAGVIVISGAQIDLKHPTKASLHPALGPVYKPNPLKTHPLPIESSFSYLWNATALSFEKQQHLLPITHIQGLTLPLRFRKVLWDSQQRVDQQHFSLFKLLPSGLIRDMFASYTSSQQADQLRLAHQSKFFGGSNSQRTEEPPMVRRMHTLPSQRTSSAAGAPAMAVPSKSTVNVSSSDELFFDTSIDYHALSRSLELDVRVLIGVIRLHLVDYRLNNSLEFITCYDNGLLAMKQQPIVMLTGKQVDEPRVMSTLTCMCGFHSDVHSPHQTWQQESGPMGPSPDQRSEIGINSLAVGQHPSAPMDADGSAVEVHSHRSSSALIPSSELTNTPSAVEPLGQLPLLQSAKTIDLSSTPSSPVHSLVPSLRGTMLSSLASSPNDALDVEHVIAAARPQTAASSSAVTASHETGNVPISRRNTAFTGVSEYSSVLYPSETPSHLHGTAGPQSQSHPLDAVCPFFQRYGHHMPYHHVPSTDSSKQRFSELTLLKMTLDQESTQTTGGDLSKKPSLPSSSGAPNTDDMSSRVLQKKTSGYATLTKRPTTSAQWSGGNDVTSQASNTADDIIYQEALQFDSQLEQRKQLYDRHILSLTFPFSFHTDNILTRVSHSSRQKVSSSICPHSAVLISPHRLHRVMHYLQLFTQTNHAIREQYQLWKQQQQLTLRHFYNEYTQQHNVMNQTEIYRHPAIFDPLHYHGYAFLPSSEVVAPQPPYATPYAHPESDAHQDTASSSSSAPPLRPIYYYFNQYYSLHQQQQQLMIQQHQYFTQHADPEHGGLDSPGLFQEPYGNNPFTATRTTNGLHAKPSMVDQDIIDAEDECIMDSFKSPSQPLLCDPDLFILLCVEDDNFIDEITREEHYPCMECVRPQQIEVVQKYYSSAYCDSCPNQLASCGDAPCSSNQRDNGMDAPQFKSVLSSFASNNRSRAAFYNQLGARTRRVRKYLSQAWNEYQQLFESYHNSVASWHDDGGKVDDSAPVTPRNGTNTGGEGTQPDSHFNHLLATPLLYSQRADGERNTTPMSSPFTPDAFTPLQGKTMVVTPMSSFSSLPPSTPQTPRGDASVPHGSSSLKPHFAYPTTPSDDVDSSMKPYQLSIRERTLLFSNQNSSAPTTTTSSSIQRLPSFPQFLQHKVETTSHTHTQTTSLDRSFSVQQLAQRFDAKKSTSSTHTDVQPSPVAPTPSENKSQKARSLVKRKSVFFGDGAQIPSAADIVHPPSAKKAPLPSPSHQGAKHAEKKADMLPSTASSTLSPPMVSSPTPSTSSLESRGSRGSRKANKRNKRNKKRNGNTPQSTPKSPALQAPPSPTASSLSSSSYDTDLITSPRSLREETEDTSSPETNDLRLKPIPETHSLLDLTIQTKGDDNTPVDTTVSSGGVQPPSDDTTAFPPQKQPDNTQLINQKILQYHLDTTQEDNHQLYCLACNDFGVYQSSTVYRCCDLPYNLQYEFLLNYIKGVPSSTNDIDLISGQTTNAGDFPLEEYQGSAHNLPNQKTHLKNVVCSLCDGVVSPDEQSTSTDDKTDVIYLDTTTHPSHVHQRQFTDVAIPQKYIEPLTQMPYFYRFLVQQTPVIPYDLSFTTGTPHTNYLHHKSATTHLPSIQTSTAAQRSALFLQYQREQQQQQLASQRKQLSLLAQYDPNESVFTVYTEEQRQHLRQHGSDLLGLAGASSGGQHPDGNKPTGGGTSQTTNPQQSSSSKVSGGTHHTNTSFFPFPYVNHPDPQQRGQYYDANQRLCDPTPRRHMYTRLFGNWNANTITYDQLDVFNILHPNEDNTSLAALSTVTNTATVPPLYDTIKAAFDALQNITLPTLQPPTALVNNNPTEMGNHKEVVSATTAALTPSTSKAQQRLGLTQPTTSSINIPKKKMTDELYRHLSFSYFSPPPSCSTQLTMARNSPHLKLRDIVDVYGDSISFSCNDIDIYTSMVNLQQQGCYWLDKARIGSVLRDHMAVLHTTTITNTPQQASSGMLGSGLFPKKTMSVAAAHNPLTTPTPGAFFTNRQVAQQAIAPCETDSIPVLMPPLTPGTSTKVLSGAAAVASSVMNATRKSVSLRRSPLSLAKPSSASVSHRFSLSSGSASHSHHVPEPSSLSTSHFHGDRSNEESTSTSKPSSTSQSGQFLPIRKPSAHPMETSITSHRAAAAAATAAVAAGAVVDDDDDIIDVPPHLREITDALLANPSSFEAYHYYCYPSVNNSRALSQYLSLRSKAHMQASQSSLPSSLAHPLSTGHAPIQYMLPYHRHHLPSSSRDDDGLPASSSLVVGDLVSSPGRVGPSTMATTTPISPSGNTNVSCLVTPLPVDISSNITPVSQYQTILQQQQQRHAMQLLASSGEDLKGASFNPASYASSSLLGGSHHQLGSAFSTMGGTTIAVTQPFSTQNTSYGSLSPLVSIPQPHVLLPIAAYPLSASSNIHHITHASMLATPGYTRQLSGLYTQFGLTFPWYPHDVPQQQTNPATDLVASDGNAGGTDLATRTPSNVGFGNPIPGVPHTTSFTHETQFQANWLLLYYHTAAESIHEEYYYNMLLRTFERSSTAKTHSQHIPQQQHRAHTKVLQPFNTPGYHNFNQSTYTPSLGGGVHRGSVFGPSTAAFGHGATPNPFTPSFGMTSFANTPSFTPGIAYQSTPSQFQQYIHAQQKRQQEGLHRFRSSPFPAVTPKQALFYVTHESSAYTASTLSLPPSCTMAALNSTYDQTISTLLTQIYSPMLAQLQHFNVVVLSLLLQASTPAFAFFILQFIESHPHHRDASRYLSTKTGTALSSSLQFGKIDTINYTDMEYQQPVHQRPPIAGTVNTVMTTLGLCYPSLNSPHTDDVEKHTPSSAHLTPQQISNAFVLNPGNTYSWIDPFVCRVYSNAFTNILPCHRKMLVLNQSIVLYYISRGMNPNYTNEVGMSLLNHLILHLATISTLPFKPNQSQFFDYTSSNGGQYISEETSIINLIMLLLTKYNVSLFSTCLDMVTQIATLTPLHLMIMLGCKKLLLTIIQQCPHVLLTPQQRLWRVTQDNRRLCTAQPKSSISPKGTNSKSAHDSKVEQVLSHRKPSTTDQSNHHQPELAQETIAGEKEETDRHGKSTRRRRHRVERIRYTCSPHDCQCQSPHDPALHCISVSRSTQISLLNAKQQQNVDMSIDHKLLTRDSLPVTLPDLAMVHHTIHRCIDDIYQIGLMLQQIYYFTLQQSLPKQAPSSPMATSPPPPPPETISEDTSFLGSLLSQSQNSKDVSMPALSAPSTSRSISSNGNLSVSGGVSPSHDQSGKHHIVSPTSLMPMSLQACLVRLQMPVNSPLDILQQHYLIQRQSVHLHHAAYFRDQLMVVHLRRARQAKLATNQKSHRNSISLHGAHSSMLSNHSSAPRLHKPSITGSSILSTKRLMPSTPSGSTSRELSTSTGTTIYTYMDGDHTDSDSSEVEDEPDLLTVSLHGSSHARFSRPRTATSGLVSPSLLGHHQERSAERTVGSSSLHRRNDQPSQSRQSSGHAATAKPSTGKAGLDVNHNPEQNGPVMTTLHDSALFAATFPSSSEPDLSLLHLLNTNNSRAGKKARDSVYRSHSSDQVNAVLSKPLDSVVYLPPTTDILSFIRLYFFYLNLPHALSLSEVHGIAVHHSEHIIMNQIAHFFEYFFYHNRLMQRMIESNLPIEDEPLFMSAQVYITEVHPYVPLPMQSKLRSTKNAATASHAGDPQHPNHSKSKTQPPATSTGKPSSSLKRDGIAPSQPAHGDTPLTSLTNHHQSSTGGHRPEEVSISIYHGIGENEKQALVQHPIRGNSTKILSKRHQRPSSP